MFTIDLKTVWAGGKRYVPIDLAASSEQHGEEFVTGANAYKDKYDDYFRTDLRIGIKTTIKNSARNGVSIFRILQVTKVSSWKDLMEIKENYIRFISRVLSLCSSIVFSSEILVRFVLK